MFFWFHEADDSKTHDSGAGDKGKGAGRGKAGNYKTLDSGAGDRSKGAGRSNAGDSKTLHSGTGEAGDSQDPRLRDRRQVQGSGALRDQQLQDP